MIKYLLSLATIILFLSKLSSQCLMYPVLLNQRVAQSNLIIEGKVINKQSFWDASHQKIYTSNLIEVYKLFKNSASSQIEIITEGGTVGNENHLYTPTLELKVGDMGIFTLNQTSQIAQYGKTTYVAYASAQGFIKYDLDANIAIDPFNKYLNASTNIYNTISQLTNCSYVTVNAVNPFQKLLNKNIVQSTSLITNFTPSTITAGTYSVLTINGSGFGTTINPSLILFKNVNDGGATTISPLASEILLWTDTQIQVKVPSLAGTGVISVNGLISSGILTIPYSHSNVNYSGYNYFSKHYAQSNNGYVWTYNSSFILNSLAKSSFERAFQTWRCATYINWTISSTTSTITTVGNDGINIVTFNPSLGTGILGQCVSFRNGCGANPTADWFVSGMDIQFSTTPGGSNWQYGPAAASSTEFDFETVTVHELGHGHQLAHVIEPNDIMHYSLAAGQVKRNLNVDDLNGGLAVMNRNSQAGGLCGLGTMIPITSGNCVLGSPSAKFGSNKTVICTGDNISYFDLSTGSPTSWVWSFQGGSPSTSNLQNPVITYSAPGSYSVSFVATNTLGTSSVTQTAYVIVTTPASLPLTQNFQSSIFPPPQWAVIDGGNDGYKWRLSTNTGQASTQSALFDNFSLLPFATNTKDQLRTYVNLTGYSNAKMTFYRAYGFTYPSPNIDSLEIRISLNCNQTSAQMYYKGGSQIATGVGDNVTLYVPLANAWVKDSIDLTPFIGNGNVSISIINRSHFGDAMYIDNINIVGTSAVIIPTALISVSSTTACEGQSILLNDASSGNPTSWNWIMAGGTTLSALSQSASVSYTSSGVKTISLTVSNGTATSTAVKTVTILPKPISAITTTNVSCFGNCNGGINISSSGGSLPYMYSMSGAPCSSFPCNSICAGTYSLNTTDNNGCVSNNIIIISQPNILATTTTYTNTTCNAICDGSIKITGSGGSPVYSYTIANLNGLCQNSICTNLCAGTYTTIIKDINNCSSISTLTLSQPPALTISATTSQTFLCLGSSTNLNASGATNYTWQPGAALSNSLSASVVATPTISTTYTLIASNANCVNQLTLSVLVSNCTETMNDIINPNLNILVVPNPSNGIVKISTDVISNLKIQLVNVLGEIVYSTETKQTNEILLNQSELSKGIYFLLVYSEKNRASIKLVFN